MGIEENKHLVFTYETLKKGFPNHVLLEDMIKLGDDEYLGIYKSKNKYPLVCGPYKVPFLFNFPDLGNRILGELYSVTKLWLNHYEEQSGSGGSIVEAVAYYEHRNYYCEEEAKGYIRRKDRPKN
ncbi:hypothetical protein MKW92_024966, partial [Papaver armeniacum]